MELLDLARRKTTQKVNLYEKVQIPGYEEAIRKIKRFLEDEDNLSKSAQKIVKKRQQKQKEKTGLLFVGTGRFRQGRAIRLRFTCPKARYKRYDGNGLWKTKAGL